MEGLGHGLFTKSPRWHSSLLSEAWTTGWLLQNQLGSLLKYYLGDLLPLCIYTWESGLAHRILPSQQGFLIFLLNERVVIINRDWFWKAAFCFVIYGAEEKSLSYLFLKTRCYIFFVKKWIEKQEHSLPLPGHCVTLGQILYFSVPYFTHVYKRNSNRNIPV